jgi:hypothetical protein
MIIYLVGEHKMRKKMALTFIIVLMLALASVMSVSADQTTAPMTVQLANLQDMGGSLVGNHGGAFWYATLAYPGGSTTLTIDMYFTPADPAMLLGVGFDLYNATGLVGSGKLVANGQMELVYTSATSEQLLLAVRNYIDGSLLSFNINASGLAVTTPMATTSAATVAAPAVTTEQPAVVAEPTAAVMPMNGVLVGNSAGSFTRFMVTYNTNNPVTVDMYFSPSDNLISKGVDVNIYGPDGAVTLNAAKINSLGTLELNFTPVAGVQYLLVVGNYDQGLMISYNIESSVSPVAVTLGG